LQLPIARPAAAAVTSAIFAFVHHALAFVLFAAVMVELILLRFPFSPATARSILRMDMIYGICAGLILIVGFGRVFHTEKGSAYYFASAPFIAKISLFIVVGLISVYPTVKFMSWRKALAAGAVPALDPAQQRSIKMILHTELTLLVLMMLCAALMARGIGMFT
jgi:putative membrane protein